MTDVHYLVDNNVLSKMTRVQRARITSRRDCWIPTEVLHEAQGFPDASILAQMEYPLTDTVVEKLRRVLASLTPGDHDLIDLYANEGNADPILIACALDASSATADTLFPDEWIIATDDEALRDKATALSVKTISSDEFLARITL